MATKATRRLGWWAAAVIAGCPACAEGVGHPLNAGKQSAAAAEHDAKAAPPAPSTKALVAFTAAATSSDRIDDDAQAAAVSPGQGVKVAGWDNVQALELASVALAADEVGKLEVCIEKDTASLALEEKPRTRLHLASCESRAGHQVAALADAEMAIAVGLRRHDKLVMSAARQRIEQLLPRIAHVAFVPPSGVSELAITFDTRVLTTRNLSQHFSVDPGRHVVHAEGVVAGLPLSFDQTFEVKEGALAAVPIVLAMGRSDYLTQEQVRCARAAKTQEAVIKCVNAKSPGS